MYSLASHYWLDEVVRQHHPGEAQARAECFGRGAYVHDLIRCHSLDGADRLPVVAELAVVVVLDDEATGRARPCGECVTSCGVQGNPGRVLVGRRHHYGNDARKRSPGQQLCAGRRDGPPLAADLTAPDPSMGATRRRYSQTGIMSLMSSTWLDPPSKSWRPDRPTACGPMIS